MTRPLDRSGMMGEADDVGLREGARHDRRRGAVAAADIGDARAALEFLDHAFQRGQPGVDQVGLVAGAEEAFGAAEQALAVVVPGDAPARAE